MYTRTITLLSLAALSWSSTVNACQNTSGIPFNHQNTTQPAPPKKSPLASQLRRQLEQRGWTSVPAEDGSIYYLSPQVETTAPPAPRQKQSLAEQLRNELENKGWVATTAEDGSIYYLPPSVRQRISPVPPKPSSLADQLRKQLEGLGWTSVPAGDGSVLYLPPQAKTPSPPILSSQDVPKAGQPLPAKSDAIGGGANTPSMPNTSSTASATTTAGEISQPRTAAKVTQAANDESPNIAREKKAVTEDSEAGAEPPQPAP